jgi:hypothetical protein
MNQHNMTCTDDQFNSIVMHQPPVFDQTQPDEMGASSMAKSGSEATAPIQLPAQQLDTPTLTGTKNSAVHVPIYDPLMNEQQTSEKKSMRHSGLEKASQKKEDETISNITIDHAAMTCDERSKSPAPKFDIDQPYYEVVGQICSHEEKMPQDVAVRTKYESNLPEYEVLFGSARPSNFAKSSSKRSEQLD